MSAASYCARVCVSIYLSIMPTTQGITRNKGAVVHVNIQYVVDLGMNKYLPNK